MRGCPAAACLLVGGFGWGARGGGCIEEAAVHRFARRRYEERRRSRAALFLLLWDGWARCAILFYCAAFKVRVASGGLGTHDVGFAKSP